MALTADNFPTILCEEFGKKQYGIVRRGNTVFVRNYHRILKNGLGLLLLDAHYKTLPTEYPNLFTSIQGRE